MTNQVLPVAGTDYSVFGTTVTVSLSVSNLPDGNLDFRAVARNGAATDSYNDWIGVDTRTTGVDVTMAIIVSGLPAGAYSWTSQHNDGGTGTTNGNLGGSADTNFLDSTGSVFTANGVSFSTGNVPDPVSVFSTNFISDGSDVSLSLIMDNGQGDATIGLFAFANSVVITEIPEPSTALLGGLGLLGLLVRRCR